MSWWTAFAITQAVELPVYLWGTRGSDLRLGERIAVGFGASALTHPVVWFVLRGLEAPWGFVAYFVLAESFAVGAEALYLRAFGVRRAGWLSLAANGASASVGLLWWLIG